MEGVDDVLLKGFETEIGVYEALPYHPNIIVPPSTLIFFLNFLHYICESIFYIIVWSWVHKVAPDRRT